MKAVAVYPKQPGSVHLRDIPNPSLDEVPDGRGVLVKVLQVGLDGTDKEINAGEYGSPPPGDDSLVIGHESFGVVEATGAQVPDLRRGDFVVATVRRPGGSLYDRIGMQDMTRTTSTWSGASTCGTVFSRSISSNPQSTSSRSRRA